MSKPAFDSSKPFSPIAANDKPAFDPNQPFQPAAQAQETEPMSMGSAAKIKAEEGATLGLRPVVAGVGAAAGDAYGQLTEGNQPFSWGQMKNAFVEGRKGAIDEQNKAQKDHPNISTAANIGGSVLTAPLLPVGEGIRGAVGLGGAMGLANAAGSSESPEDALTKTIGGAAGGAAGYGLAKTVGATLGTGLNALAENKAFKAAGAMLKDFRSAFNKDPEQINELGRTMIDSGLVKAGDTVKSIAQKSEVVRRETGRDIGKVYDSVMETLTAPESNLSPEVVMHIQSEGFHPEMQADSMKAAVAQSLRGKPGSTGAINKANQVIDELALNGNNITPEHALELKGHVDSMINWSKKAVDLPIEQDALKIIRNQIQERLTNQVSLMDQALNTNQTKELVRLNKLYGSVSTIANIAKDRVLRESANQSFGLGEKMGGGLGAMLGLGAEAAHGGGMGLPIVGAIGAGLAVKGARHFGNAATSEISELAGNALQNSSTYVPGLMQALPSEGQLREPPKMSTTIRPLANRR